MEEDKTAKTKEIKDFSLSYDGMYWIRQGNEHYPVLLQFYPVYETIPRQLIKTITGIDLLGIIKSIFQL